MNDTDQSASSNLHGEPADGQDIEAVEKKGVYGSGTEAAKDNSIDPRDEVTGWKLLILHTGLCLCTFLVGLVCYTSQKRYCSS